MANLVLNGKSIDNIDDIAENFVEEDVLREFQSGSLATWLEEYGYDDEFARVRSIKPTASSIRILSGIIDALNLDDEVVAKAHARREEQQRKEETVRKAREEQQRKEEEERQRKEREEQQRKEEEDRLRREREERQKKEKEERQRREREEQQRREREIQQKKNEEERQRREREEQQRKLREDARRKAHEALLWNKTRIDAGTCSTITLPGGVPIEMIYCPPGEFLMGSPAHEEGRNYDEVQHHVRLTKGFWLGKYPVTQLQWQSVMRSNPSRFKGDDLRPVETISWNDCQEFIQMVNASLNCGARLPTEAEWEYACRAGTTTPFNFYGRGNNYLNSMLANCDGNYPYPYDGTRWPTLGRTSFVGNYNIANPWGFYDMHGNVFEWCNDRYGAYPSTSVTDPAGPTSGTERVLRGGDWFSSAGTCRSACRRKWCPTDAISSNGFRLCCSAGPHR